jgi:hypothetical protein
VTLVDATCQTQLRETKLAFVPRARIEAAGGQLFAPPLYFGVALLASG